MTFDHDFPGGNIEYRSTEGDTVFLERELRDTEGEWFYWAFRARGCGGRTLTFRFPDGTNRVGYFGAAVSHDLKHWHWSEGERGNDRFTYAFAPDENDVYFAHNMIYSHDMLKDFCQRESLTEETATKSLKGRDVPVIRFGTGRRQIVLTARHHACESTGNYVLEGTAEYLHRHMPADFSVVIVPFVDMDGVTDGDQGKNRKPHDHNRDYLDDETEMLYPETRFIRSLDEDPRTECFFDFHSPWHVGGTNDHAFIVHPKEYEALEQFAGILTEVCRSHPTALQYSRPNDARSGVGWNTTGKPTSTAFALKHPHIRIAFSLETTYFGTPESFFTQDSGRELGRCFGEALLRWLAEC